MTPRWAAAPSTLLPCLLCAVAAADSDPKCSPRGPSLRVCFDGCCKASPLFRPTAARPTGRAVYGDLARSAGLAYRAFEDPDAPAATLQTAYDGFAANASAFAAFLRASLPEPWQGKAT